MARLTVTGEPQGNQMPAVYEGRGVKAPRVTCIRPEAVRSIPGQGEALVKQHPNWFLFLQVLRRFNSLRSLSFRITSEEV